MAILFEHANVLTMDSAGRELHNAFVAVADRQITYVGTERPTGDFDRCIDARGKLLLPGFVNAHTHLPMSLLRSYGGGCDLDTWLHKYIFPVEAKLDARAVRAGVRLSLLELIAAGVTCVADMYMFCEEIAEEIMTAGLSGNIARGTTLFSEDFAAHSHEGYQDSLRLYERFHGANEGQILVDACIHGEYTSNEKLWRAMADFARERGLGMHVHLSETRAEHEACLARHGKTPTQVLADCGIWDTRAIAAHAVWTDAADWSILQEKGVSVVHNPVSNCKLGSGLAPITAMQKAGVRVALGTDGVASNNSHDMLEEIKLAALLQMGSLHEPTALSSRAALAMATCEGAKALGRKTGQIAAGYVADIILLDMQKPHLYPAHDLADTLVYAARGADVWMNMARGEIIYQEGEYFTLNQEAIRREVEDYALPLLFG